MIASPRLISLLALAGIALAPASRTAVAQQEPPPPSQDGAGGDVVVVEVTGEGISRDLALKDALRRALEQGGKMEIFSDTRVENFELMHDTILARAEGIVTDYRILEEREVIGGTWRVRIRARVSRQMLKDSWGAIQNVLNQIGRPKIMVWVNERIDGRLEEQSLLETRIEERLLKSGFDLVARTGIEDIRQKELSAATARDDVARVQAIARDFDAHLFIVGTANANQAGIETIHGVPIAFYNCDAQLKAYYTDTAQLLASHGLPNTRGGARGRKEFSPQAGKTALGIAGGQIVEEIYGQVMVQWATAISAGGELVIEVDNIKVPAAVRLRRALAAIEGVEQVHYDYTQGRARYRLKARYGAQDFVELLINGEFERVMEITDVKLNRIQARGLEED